MSIRIILCFLFVFGFSIYAYRNWFASLCASIALMAVIQHPDMPKSIAGIQGLNPWNILFFNVLVGWWQWRKREGAVWDMPPPVFLMFALFFAVVIFSFLRLLLDGAEFWTTSDIISEKFINCVKWVIPSFLLFDGCRTRRRIIIAIAVILGLYAFLAIQVIRWMPLSYAVSGADLSRRASKIIQNEIGYNRVTLSMMLSGASWAVLTTIGLAQKKWHKLGILGLFAIISLGQALTGGRSGYVAWVSIGLILCLLRWRRLLPLVPVTVIALFTLLPGVRERFFQGFGGKQGAIVVQDSDYEMTSGRTLIWPHVIEKIKEAPLIGYGREAMTRTGLQTWLWEEYQEAFPHPHNLYLELLLDNGIIGAILVAPFVLLVLGRAIKLLLDRSDPLYGTVGGVTCALLFSLLIAGIGGQTFYPREGSIGLWAAIGIMLRVSVERDRSRLTEGFIDDPVEELTEREAQELTPKPAPF